MESMAVTAVSPSPIPDPEFQERVLTELQRRMRKEQFETWFRGFQVVALTDRDVEFAVPTAFVRDWVQRNFMASIVESVTEVIRVRTESGSDAVPKIRLSVSPETKAIEPMSAASATHAQPSGTPRAGELAARVVSDLEPSASAATSAGASAGGANSNAAPVGRNEPVDKAPRGRGLTSLNRNYTFEHFVVGPSNRLSHAAALAIGENPGCSYNPLFIHGNVGLGKTHLLQAVCHSIRRRNPAAQVVYLTSEEFTNQFIHSIQSNQLERFRSYHREADVLVVDDIQFLASKDKTQEEFFHTFNSLYQHQKQIVLSSDRSPQDIPTLEERLVSRFKWGLVTEVEAPDFETRVAIVQRKARLRGQENGLPDDVAYMVAERMASNIRELEGAVIKVLGMAQILGRPISIELAEDALKGVAKARNHHVTMDRIMEVVTDQFPVSSRDIIGKGRTQAISYPRQVAMYLARKHTDHSLEEIGKYFGNRDHTTVLYSVNKIEDRVDGDRMLRETLDTLSGRLQR